MPAPTRVAPTPRPPPSRSPCRRPSRWARCARGFPVPPRAPRISRKLLRRPWMSLRAPQRTARACRAARAADKTGKSAAFALISAGMSQSRPFRVVIIGIGAIAELIAIALREIPQARLIAGSCRTEAKGRKFAEQYSCAWYGDTNAMLDKEKPDVA